MRHHHLTLIKQLQHPHWLQDSLLLIFSLLRSQTTVLGHTWSPWCSAHHASIKFCSRKAMMCLDGNESCEVHCDSHRHKTARIRRWKSENQSDCAADVLYWLKQHQKNNTGGKGFNCPFTAVEIISDVFCLTFHWLQCNAVGTPDQK